MNYFYNYFNYIIYNYEFLAINFINCAFINKLTFFFSHINLCKCLFIINLILFFRVKNNKIN